MAEQSTQQLAQSLDGLTKKILKLQGQMKGLDKTSLKYKQTQEKLTKTQRDAARASDQLAKKRGFLTAKNKNHAKSIKAADDAQKRYNATEKRTQTLTKKGNSNLGKRIAVLGKYLAASAVLAGGLALLRELFVGSAKRAIALEKALGDVAAVAGLTTEEVGRLKKVVFEVAGTTTLTTTEVVALQKELAKLGTSIGDIENLTKPIALLSQALGETGEDTAAFLKKVQNQFGLVSEEAGQTANTIVAAVNESALTMNDLATGLQYVGPLAKQAGLSFEETASFLGVLADNGFRASRAGTGFRAILSEASAAGKPLNEFLGELEERGISTGDAIELFTKRGAAAAVTIIQQGDAVRELNAEMENQNRLFEANAKQLGTTGGQIQLLNSAYERFSVNFGNYITQTDLFINLLGKLDPATAAQARIFRAIAQGNDEVAETFYNLRDSMVGFDEETGKTIVQQDELMKIFIAEGKINEAQSKVLAKNFAREKNVQAAQGKKLTFMQYLADAQTDLYNLADGTLKLAEQEAKAITERNLAAKAANATYEDYATIVKELNDEAIRGNLTDEAKETIQQRLQQQITKTTEAYDKANTVESKQILEKRIELYERLSAEAGNLANNESAVASNRTANVKKEADEIRERIRLRKEYLKDELEQQKDILETELLRASTIEDLADRESTIAAAREGYAEGVSAANRAAAEDIATYIPLYEQNLKIVTKAVDELSRAANLTQSDGLNVFGDALTGFQKAQDELDKLALKSSKEGGISQKVYEARSQELRDAFKVQIDSVIESLGLEGEAAEVVRAKVEEFLNKPYELKPTAKDERNALEQILGFDPDKAGEIDKYIQVIEKALSEAADVYKAFADSKLENLKSEADAELDVIANRYKVEEDILQAQLDNQLISEGQFRAKQLDLRRAQIAEENAINRGVFEAQKKQDKQLALVEGLEAVATSTINAFSTYPDPVTAGIVSAAYAAVIGATTAAKMGAIGSRKFFPKKFEDGGIVSGPSHSEGGVPFTVQGQGGYEMEGGEYIINKRSASMHKDLLDRINSAGRTSPIVGTRKFAQGGQVVGNGPAESLEYLKAIAEGVSVTANNTGKPTRAYVSDKDLSANSRERSIRQNNDRV